MVLKVLWKFPEAKIPSLSISDELVGRPLAAIDESEPKLVVALFRLFFFSPSIPAHCWMVLADVH